jgi:hypothetical protein
MFGPTGRKTITHASILRDRVTSAFDFLVALGDLCCNHEAIMEQDDVFRAINDKITATVWLSIPAARSDRWSTPIRRPSASV